MSDGREVDRVDYYNAVYAPRNSTLLATSGRNFDTPAPLRLPPETLFEMGPDGLAHRAIVGPRAGIVFARGPDGFAPSARSSVFASVRYYLYPRIERNPPRRSPSAGPMDPRIGRARIRAHGLYSRADPMDSRHWPGARFPPRFARACTRVGSAAAENFPDRGADGFAHRARVCPRAGIVLARGPDGCAPLARCSICAYVR